MCWLFIVVSLSNFGWIRTGYDQYASVPTERCRWSAGSVAATGNFFSSRKAAVNYACIACRDRGLREWCNFAEYEQCRDLGGTAVVGEPWGSVFSFRIIPLSCRFPVVLLFRMARFWVPFLFGLFPNCWFSPNFLRGLVLRYLETRVW